MTLFLCVHKKLVGRLVCQSIAQMSKSHQTADPGVHLYSCNLPTFIHFHLLSFTFIYIHSPSFTSYFHPFMHASIKMLIYQKRSFFFSQLKRVTLLYQMKLKFQCHTFRCLMEKINKKAKFAPKLVSRDLRKNK